ncbi:putative NRPS-like enzyme [Ilyonectria sp. MPI-CAGE-AT-0026]|nr:putative NRPS-like enzyme [Ilyonectria sp. MPI-CAGE-AT-0026]
MAHADRDVEPHYERRLMLHVLDGIAASEPSRPFVHAPNTSNPSDGWNPQLTEAYGPAWKGTFPTVAYIGSMDVRYVAIVLGCMKAGYQALLLSPRNSKEAQQHLLQATDCDIFWHADTFTPTIKSWIGERKMQTREVPSADIMIAATSPPFPYTRTFEEGRWDPSIVFHTSGSTGLPKPVVQKQGAFAITDALRDMPASHAEKIFMPMPLFHAAGMILLLKLTLAFGATFALTIPDRPLSSDLVLQSLKHVGAQGTILPPVILEELSTKSESLAELAKLKYVGFGGGNLGQQAGKTLIDNGVLLTNGIAATEYLPFNWQYFIFNSEVMGCVWRPLVVRRKNTQDKDPGLQALFYTFPDLDEWSTKDLYKPHPTLHDHWMYCGRLDDVIVFSNGEKLNPVSMEEHIIGHPAIKGALVVGQERFQPALILEPMTPCADDAAAQALIEDVWPLVEKANAETVTHGKIARWLVTVLPPGKDFLRTPKGTTLRTATVQLFAEEIESVYQNAETTDPADSVDLDLTNEDTLAKSIIELVTKLSGQDGFKIETDFFTVGFDSLQVMNSVKLLRIGLEGAGIKLEDDLMTPRIVYENPTPRLLAQYLYSAVQQCGISAEFDAERQAKVLKDILAKYTEALPASNPNKPEPLSVGQTVVVTGTTGSLGAYLLDRLCKLESVKKVIALNRGKDGGESDSLQPVEFLETDLSLPDLGLGQTKYTELLGTVDRIVHNAWPVNFQISVNSFELHIRGVRHLVDFSSAAVKHVPVVFLSSISTAGGWTATEPVPEHQLDDPTMPIMGYGQSKHTGSLILDAAARQSGIPAASIRVGQIAGPRSSEGAWNRQEFIPSLIASSVYLGALPDHIGPSQVVDWIPIEDVAELILEISGVTVELTDAVKSCYSDKIQQIIPLEEWILKLEESALDPTNIDKNPGVKLLDTYRGMLGANQAGLEHVTFSMERTKTRSPTVERLSEIRPGLLKNWCQQWDF